LRRKIFPFQRWPDFNFAELIFLKKKSPCEAEGEEKARYPQGLRGKIYELVC
jgi:hypothetical protein